MITLLCDRCKVAVVYHKAPEELAGRLSEQGWFFLRAGTQALAFCCSGCCADWILETEGREARNVWALARAKAVAKARELSRDDEEGRVLDDRWRGYREALVEAFKIKQKELEA